ncbi:Dual-specificity RNA methyltransferase RlmN [Candidatus Magnetomoraceae bacterium gMMP-15]
MSRKNNLNFITKEVFKKMSVLPDIKSLSDDEFSLWLKKHQIEPYRKDQILNWVYFYQADSFDVMSNLSKTLRSLLSDSFSIKRLKQKRVQTSSDRSRKYLFGLEDGHHIESVLIPEKDHFTLCISTQVGCAQGCRFCLTAKGGFIRNLTHAEIISQVRDIMYETNTDPDNTKRLSNIVLMGMGEPLANYSNVIQALKIIMNGTYGLRFSSRKITLSTSGLVPKLADLGRDSKVQLAISLNATDNKTRDMLMPINRKYPLKSLLKACRDYPLSSSRRRITFEYILIKDINDSIKDAKQLARLLQPIHAKINLIPFNEHEGCSFKRPDESVILKFQKILLDSRYTVIIRRSKGEDISAACGQLRADVVNIKNKLNI